MLYVESVLKSLESREEEKTCESSVAFSLKFFLSSSSSLRLLAPNICIALICQHFPRMVTIAQPNYPKHTLKFWIFVRMKIMMRNEKRPPGPHKYNNLKNVVNSQSQSCVGVGQLVQTSSDENQLLVRLVCMKIYEQEEGCLLRQELVDLWTLSVICLRPSRCLALQAPGEDGCGQHQPDPLLLTSALASASSLR